MSKKTKGRNEILTEEELLKAVVVADSFDERFGPLTSDKPKALHPLATVPIIEYCLELLDSSEVSEVFFLSCFHTDMLRSYIKNSRWSSSTMKINVVALDSCISFGDCLRELDAKALIRNNFVLLNADNISNIPLQPIAAELKSISSSDKGCLMNLIFKKCAIGTASYDEELMLIKSSKTNKIVHYQKMSQHPRLEIPITVLQENNVVDICCDIVNTQISLCSPVVLSLFADNFDFQTFDDFIRGILINEEILGNSIYAHIVEEGYANRASNLHMYSLISHDVMGRWTYPLVPDLLQCMSYSRHNVYKDRNVVLERGSKIKENVVLGENTSVGNKSIISHSVVGKNCKIGTNVVIEDSFLWDNVVIEDNCCITKSILADNVVVKKDSQIKPGCVIGQHVVLGPGIELKEGTLLVAEEQQDEFADESQQKKEYPKDVVGSEGCGYVYNVDLSSDNEDLALAQDLWDLKINRNQDDDDISSVSSAMSMGHENDFDDGRAESPLHEDVKLFSGEVFDSLVRGIEEKINNENLILEINSSKYAYNVTMKEVNTNVTTVILSIAIKDKPQLAVNEYYTKLKSVLVHLCPLLTNYIKSHESQMDCILAIENFMTKHQHLASTMVKILHFLYEKDILSEDVIIQWYEREPDFDRKENHNKIRNTVSSFINWLQEAEEETDSEEESD